MKETSYGFGKTVSLGFEQAVEAARKALKDQGFGVLTQIDVRETMKNKLDVEFRKYMILGACNPPYALRALGIEMEIGLLLPCNVIVYEDDSGKSVVMAFDPAKGMAMVNNSELSAVGREVRDKLMKMIESLPSTA